MDDHFTEYISARTDSDGAIIISMLNHPTSGRGRIEEVRLSARQAAMFAGEIVALLQEAGEVYLSAPQIAKELGISRQAVHSRINSSTMPTPDIEINQHKGARGGVNMRYWTRRALVRANILRERGSSDVGLIGGVFWLLMLFYLFFG